MAKPANLAQIHGRIQFVKANANYTVQVVDHFPDLKVQKVSMSATTPGKWQIVTSTPDFTIQIIKANADFKIQYVKDFPGVV